MRVGGDDGPRIMKAMKRLRTGIVFCAIAAGGWGVLRAQKPFQDYPGVEYENFPLPSDYQEKTEWTRARLKYDSFTWFTLRSATATIAGPSIIPAPTATCCKACAATRIDTRSVEQIVELDGTTTSITGPLCMRSRSVIGTLPTAKPAQLRDYLLRGGFFMCDDFHGTIEWDNFMASMKKVFPDRPVVDLDNKDPIFHVIYDLDDRFQVPGAAIPFQRTIYEYDGYGAQWRGIYDDKGRVMVAICHNMDLGDAWEWSDDPRYPEKFASLAYRIAVNYFTYDLTH